MTAELACNRDVFSDDEEQHYEELLATWRNAIEERRMLDAGIEFSLKDDGGMRATLEAFIPFEQRCCPFFTFQIEDSGPGQLTFRMTGPPGTREFILTQ